MTDPTTNLDISNLPVFVPVLTIEKFASSIGVSPHVVEGWIKRGYISTVKIGRRRLVNVIALIQRLVEINSKLYSSL